MRQILLTLILLVLAATTQAGEVDRLYVIDCGWAHAVDQSRWSPGVNVGVPIDFSDNCYLIHHSSEGYLLWDTGIPNPGCGAGRSRRQPRQCALPCAVACPSRPRRQCR